MDVEGHQDFKLKIYIYIIFFLKGQEKRYAYCEIVCF